MEKKYEEIYAKIKDGITCGKYAIGSKLPSKREAADIFGVSVITVESAYELLISEGFVISMPRSGYYVCDPDSVIPRVETKKRTLYPRLDEPSFSSVIDFESSVWFKTVRKVMADYGNLLFEKAPARGCNILRNAIAAYLWRYRGMDANPYNIIVGSGAESLYENIVKILGNDVVYAIENPSYAQIRLTYGGMGCKLAALPLGNDGIESAALDSTAFGALHVTPFHSYPSGISTSLHKRREYLSFAKRYEAYVIEDDFDSEFFVKGRPIETLYSMAPERVIYLNTFSKSLSPAMRLGYMILPESLNKTYDAKLGKFSCSVPVMDQYVLAEFISSGNFERHLNRRRKQLIKI